MENGGGIFFPRNYRNFKIGDYKRKNDDCVVQLGRSYDDIRRFFLQVKDQFGIKGFGDMDSQEIIKLKAKYPGSLGWNEAVIGILDRWL